MKAVYPIILSKGEKFILVKVPDLDLMTQGLDLVDAIKMARDIINLTCVELQDEGKLVPAPSTIESIAGLDDSHQIVTLVDVDFDQYRAELDNR